jgi:G3E family GTPase
VRAINPSARIHRTERASVPLDAVLDRGAFDLSRALDNDPHFLDHDHPDHVCSPDCDHDHEHDHHHDTCIMTTTIITITLRSRGNS